LDDGRSISVAEYFAHEKRIRLSYPHLPCLHVGSLNRAKPIYVPAEVSKASLLSCHSVNMHCCLVSIHSQKYLAGKLLSATYIYF
jgi:hypothetical protein